MRHQIKSLLITLLLALTATPALAGQIRLAAGMGMKEVLNVLSNNFIKAHPGAVFIKTYAAAGVLAMQIENGAPIDLYISADTKWVNYLHKKGLIDGEWIAPFAWNDIVIVGHPSVTIGSMKDLTKLKRIAIGNPKNAPAGESAIEAFRNAGIAPQLAGKLVMTRDILQCLMYAETEAVDASVTHLTEALTAKRAKILYTVPHNLYTRTPFTMAVTQRGETNADAKTFFSYLQSPEAKAILEKYGYLKR
ncbi:MAG TPA: molybdate ABC transporter substrate-binding protein [Chlorobaculum parvum]|uniref:Molybdate ABC transporter substrate-binding protein n=1 Tax=Chlorobaculum parvum TaxID=274539 RepID=A0A7C5HGN8_9CHLB|nr:molybdate ABC transporter substrate-binding protein [Chlorobaculum parvum]